MNALVEGRSTRTRFSSVVRYERTIWSGVGSSISKRLRRRVGPAEGGLQAMRGLRYLLSLDQEEMKSANLLKRLEKKLPTSWKKLPMAVPAPAGSFQMKTMMNAMISQSRICFSVIFMMWRPPARHEAVRLRLREILRVAFAVSQRCSKAPPPP